MAAVLSPPPAVRAAPAPGPGRRLEPCPPSARPALRLIQGGRSPAARAATFRRRRLVAALLLVTVTCLALVAARGVLDAAGSWAAPQPAPIEGPTVEVQARPGDTLWSLARQVRPQGDVRPAIEAMLAERGTAELEVGEVVRVPAP